MLKPNNPGLSNCDQCGSDQLDLCDSAIWPKLRIISCLNCAQVYRDYDEDRLIYRWDNNLFEPETDLPSKYDDMAEFIQDTAFL